MIKINREDLSTSATGNPQVTKELAAIRGAKVIAFAERAEQNRVISDSLDAKYYQEADELEKGRITKEKIKHTVGAMVEEASDAATGVYEKTKASLMETGFVQGLRWKLLNRGTTYAFDGQIERLNAKAAAVEDKKQREARKFDELKTRFETGVIDIERNKREHLAEFDASLEKIRQKNNEIQEKRKEHDRKVQALKDSVNNRITGKINTIKEEYNLDFIKERQKEFKDLILAGENSLQDAKKKHEELKSKISLMYGDGISGWFRRRKASPKGEKVLQDLTPEELKDLSDDEKKSIQEAQKDIKKQIEDEKMAFSAVAEKIKSEFELNEKEIKRLEKNIERIRQEKNTIDAQIVSADAQIGELEAERKGFGIGLTLEGIKDEHPGNHTEVKTFATFEEAEKGVRELFDSKVALYDQKLKSTGLLFSDADSFNSKLAGFDTVVSDRKITNVLNGVKKEANELSFTLEEILLQIQETIKKGIESKTLDKDTEVKLYDLAAKVSEKIDSLKDVTDKIAVDEKGEIKDGVDQRAVIHQLCSETSVTTLDEEELFGNMPDPERADLLSRAIEQIDSLPPANRLKAYTKLVVFAVEAGLMSKPYMSAVYEDVYTNKLTKAFKEIASADEAIAIGFDCIDELSADNRTFSTVEAMSAILSGITNTIERTNKEGSIEQIVATFRVFVYRCSRTHDQACQVLNLEGDTFGGESAIEEMAKSAVSNMTSMGGDDVIDRVKSIAEIAEILSSRNIDESIVRGYFDTALDFLEKHASKGDLSQTNDTTVHSEYIEAQKYIKEALFKLGYDQGKEVPGLEGLTDEKLRDRVVELTSREDYLGLTEYAVHLVHEGHPEQADAVFGFARIQAFNIPSRLLEIANIMQKNISPEDEWYKHKSLDLYDEIFEKIKIQQYNLTDSLSLFESVTEVGYIDLQVKVAEFLVDESLGSDTTRSASVSVGLLQKLFEAAKSSKGSGIHESVERMVSGIFEKQKENFEQKSEFVHFIEILNLNKKEEEAKKFFATYVKGMEFESAVDLFDAVATSALPSEYVNYIIDTFVPDYKDTEASNYAKSIESDLKMVPMGEEYIGMIVTLYNKLSEHGLAGLQEKYFERKLNTSNQDQLLEVVDAVRVLESQGEVPDALTVFVEEKVDTFLKSHDTVGVLTELVIRWADKDNNLYIKPLTLLKEKVGNDVDMKLELASIMNEHEIGLGLQQLLFETEQLIVDRVNEKQIADEVDMGQLQKLKNLYHLVFGLASEAKRFDEVVEEIESREIGVDALNEKIDVFGDGAESEVSDLEPEYRQGPGNQDGVSSDINATDLTTSTQNIKPKAPKKKNFLQRLFGGLFGGFGSNDTNNN